MCVNMAGEVVGIGEGDWCGSDARRDGEVDVDGVVDIGVDGGPVWSLVVGWQCDLELLSVAARDG